MKTHVLAGALSLLLSGGTGALAQEKPAPAHATLAAGPVQSGLSVYQLDTRFTDPDGKPVRLKDFRGQPVLLTMFYGTCPMACPLLMSRIKRVEATLPPEARARVRVVLVSLDPERDTPEFLRKLTQAHGVDAARWRMLVTSEDGVREVAAVLGIRYRPVREGGMNHSSVITLLDRDGVIDTRVEGPDAATDTLAARLAELASKPR